MEMDVYIDAYQARLAHVRSGRNTYLPCVAAKLDAGADIYIYGCVYIYTYGCVQIDRCKYRYV